MVTNRFIIGVNEWLQNTWFRLHLVWRICFFINRVFAWMLRLHAMCFADRTIRRTIAEHQARSLRFKLTPEKYLSPWLVYIADYCGVVWNYLKSPCEMGTSKQTPSGLKELLEFFKFEYNSCSLTELSHKSTPMEMDGVGGWSGTVAKICWPWTKI